MNSSNKITPDNVTRKLVEKMPSQNVSDWMEKATQKDALSQIIQNSGCAVTEIREAVVNLGQEKKCPEGNIYKRATFMADQSVTNERVGDVLNQLNFIKQAEKDRSTTFSMLNSPN